MAPPQRRVLQVHLHACGGVCAALSHATVHEGHQALRAIRLKLMSYLAQVVEWRVPAESCTQPLRGHQAFESAHI
jgi:hypothetical protein